MTYNKVKFYENKKSSPLLIDLIGKLCIHLPDKDVMEYLYTLNKVNISEKRIFNIRRELSAYANEWTEKNLKKNLTKLSENYEDYERLAFGLDEGKVHIRSKQKNKSTNKYNHYWMNVKLGIVYPFDENGKKCGTTLQISEIEKKINEFKSFDLKILLELSKYEKAKDKITLSDGASGYLKLLEDICPNSYHILDAMHLKEHMWVLAKLIYPDENGKTSEKAEKFVDYNYEILKEKGVLNLLTNLDIDKPKGKGSIRKLKIWNREINYIKNNKSRLDYPEYIRQNFPLGSGVVESSVKYICNKRLKNGSPIWLLESINGLLKLRIIYLNKFYDDFWRYRKNKLQEKFEICA